MKKKNGSSGRGKGAARGGEYKVGYGRPPVHTRFQRGESGNKRGRPKNKPPETSSSVLMSILDEKREIEIGGKKRRVTLREVLFRQVVNAAAKGDRRCIKAIMENNIEKQLEQDFEQMKQEESKAATGKRLEEMAQKYRPKLLAAHKALEDLKKLEKAGKINLQEVLNKAEEDVKNDENYTIKDEDDEPEGVS